MNFTVSKESTKLDVDMIHDYLCNRSYWAKGRTLEQVKRSIEHSICFGVYDSELKETMRWHLDTLDAHPFYARFGFGEPKFPGRAMQKRKE